VWKERLEAQGAAGKGRLGQAAKDELAHAPQSIPQTLHEHEIPPFLSEVAGPTGAFITFLSLNKIKNNRGRHAPDPPAPWMLHGPVATARA
jgi:hypothetical protein